MEKAEIVKLESQTIYEDKGLYLIKTSILEAWIDGKEIRLDVDYPVDKGVLATFLTLLRKILKDRRLNGNTVKLLKTEETIAFEGVTYPENAKRIKVSYYLGRVITDYKKGDRKTKPFSIIESGEIENEFGKYTYKIEVLPLWTSRVTHFNIRINDPSL